MPRKSKEQRMAELHATAMQQFEASFNATKEDRERALQARRFVNIRGAQWEWDEQNDFQNKQKMEIDLVYRAVNKIRNEYRKNRIGAKFLPKDGSEADALADAVAGRYRADTMDSRGREARTMAFDSAVEGGFGGMRLRAEYEDDERQRICLEPINDAEASLFFDVNAKAKDKSDAYHAFHVQPWTREAYVAEWGEDGATWPQELRQRYTYQWYGAGNDLVMVAEYFVKEDPDVTYRVWENAVTEEREEFLESEVDDADIAALEAQGFVEVESRIEDGCRVLKYVMNGAKVLEGPEVIPGECIPLVPQYGHRTVINHVERFFGRVSKSIDLQILLNLQVSKVAATAATSVDRTPIFLAEQIAPYGLQWSEAHKTNPAYLQIASITDMSGNIQPTGPVGYLDPPPVNPATGALIDITAQFMADQMGNQANAEAAGPQVSGYAMELAQGQIDLQSFGYMDNAADAERRVAEIYQGMAAVLYAANAPGNAGRKLKTMSEDMQRGQVELGKKVLDAKTGKIEAEIDFSRARFDVEVDVGPASSSRRRAMVRTLSEIMERTDDPEARLVLNLTAIMNSDEEGMSDIRQWARKKLVALGVEQPNKEEAAQMAAAQGEQAPDPQAELAGAMAQEAQAKAAKAVADTALAEARTQETQAKTAATLAGIPIEQQRAALATAQAIMNAEGPNDLG